MKRLVKGGLIYKSFFVFLFVITSSFSDIEYENVVNRITKKTIKKLSEEKQLRVIGTGGGLMGDIYKMSISFQFFHQVNLEEARSLLVDVVSIYLKDINETKNIRPYLHNYPFTDKDVEIDIWIKNPDYSNVSYNQIDYIIATKGELHYHLPLEVGTYKRRLLHKETYAEAVQILQGQRERDKDSVKGVENKKPA